MSRAIRPRLWLQLAVLSLALVYGLWSAKELHEFYDEGDRSIFLPIDHGPRHWALVTVPLFVGMSIATTALGAFASEGRRFWRRPGIVPGVVVLPFVIRNLIESVATQIRWNSSWVGRAPLQFWGNCVEAMLHPANVVTVSHNAGFAVAATWLALGIGKWWHPAPTVIDRLGRVLGCYWIVVFVIDPFHSSLV